jgi:hypothetical protein
MRACASAAPGERPSLGDQCDGPFERDGAGEAAAVLAAARQRFV